MHRCFHTTWFILNLNMDSENLVNVYKFPHHMVHFKQKMKNMENENGKGFHTTWYILNIYPILLKKRNGEVSTPHGTF